MGRRFLIVAFGIMAFCSGSAIGWAGHGHGGCGGPRFSFGFNFAPVPYYPRPVYAYPAYPYPYPYGYGYPYYYGAAPAPAYPAYASSPPATSQPIASQPAATPQPTLAPAPARQVATTQGSFEIRLPEPQGEAWVDGHKVGGSGSQRTFRDLAAQDAPHIYKVTAAWHENGKIVTEERMVDLEDGRRLTVDFTRSAETAIQAQVAPADSSSR